MNTTLAPRARFALAAATSLATAASLAACEAPPSEPADCQAEPLTERRLHEYDPVGRLIRLVVEREGVPVVVFVYGYDAAGRRVSVERRDPARADEALGVEERVFGDDGRLLTTRRFEGGLSQETRITRDAAGRPVALDVGAPVADPRTGSSDATPADATNPFPLEGADERLLQPAEGETGVLWYAVGLEFALPAEVLLLDLWALGVGPQHAEVTWADAGPPANLRDTDGDGRPDLFAYETATRTADALVRAWDADADGVAESSRVERLGPDGAPVEILDYAEGDPPDAPGGHTWIAADHTTETVGGQTIRLDFDAEGHRVRRAEDRDGDGTTDWEKTYEYDARGRRVRETRDRDADGAPDQVWTYTYGDDDRLALEAKVEASSLPFCEVP